MRQQNKSRHLILELAMLNDELLTVKEVTQLTKMSKTTIYRKIQDGEFPRNRNFGGNLVRWSNNEIQQWIRGVFDAQPAS